MNANSRTDRCDRGRLGSFINGELTDAQERDFTLHLNTCEQCRRSLEQLAAEPDAWREAETLLKPTRFDSLAVDEFSDCGLGAKTSRQPLQIQNVLDALAPTDDPQMLGRLGGYEVSGIVGFGGMGVVLKAIDKSLDRTVAIKVLAPHLATSGAARKRFAREAKAAAAVLHPNVIAIHGVSNDESLPYLVMPYLRGTSLQKRLDQEGPLSLNEILRIGSQIAAGLSAAHAQGLVHRDIKPANILLEDGVERVTITDFGLARAVDDATITHSGVIAGTPQYMSPEQARGETLEQRSDLFSLGSVLYAMCTGRPPFRAESSYGVLRRITDEEPNAIRNINADIPDWLCQIISRLMSKQPNDRFESAGEVAKLLEECLAHVQQPTGVPLPISLSSLSKEKALFAMRTTITVRKGVFTMFAAIGMSLLGFVFWQTTTPPDIAGKWTDEEWGDVVLTATTPGLYEGTYSGTFGEKPGTLQVQWSRIENRFNGTWREGNDRKGKISLRLVNKEIRGAWTTSSKAEINAGIPDLADLLWVRPNSAIVGPKSANIGSENMPRTEGIVTAASAGKVEISIGHDDGIKVGMKLVAINRGEHRSIIEITSVSADKSIGRIIQQDHADTPIERGDTVIGTESVVQTLLSVPDTDARLLKVYAIGHLPIWTQDGEKQHVSLLLRFLKATIDPPSWADGTTQAAYDSDHLSLVVRTSARNQEQFASANWTPMISNVAPPQNRYSVSHPVGDLPLWSRDGKAQHVDLLVHYLKQVVGAAPWEEGRAFAWWLRANNSLVVQANDEMQRKISDAISVLRVEALLERHTKLILNRDYAGSLDLMTDDAVVRLAGITLHQTTVLHATLGSSLDHKNPGTVAVMQRTAAVLERSKLDTPPPDALKALQQLTKTTVEGMLNRPGTLESPDEYWRLLSVASGVLKDPRQFLIDMMVAGDQGDKTSPELQKLPNWKISVDGDHAVVTESDDVLSPNQFQLSLIDGQWKISGVFSDAYISGAIAGAMFGANAAPGPSASNQGSRDLPIADGQSNAPENWDVKVFRGGPYSDFISGWNLYPADTSEVTPVARRLEICEATDLNAEEAAILAKTEASREILYLNSDGKVILLRRKPTTLLDENDLLSAVAKADPNRPNSYSIDLELQASATKRFAADTRRLSQQNPSVRLAILIPGKVLAAPYLRAEIGEGKIKITGTFTKQEAQQLAAELVRRPASPPGQSTDEASESKEDE